MRKIINNKLTADQKHVLFEKGTEAAFSGKFYLDKKKGIYMCLNCGNPLFPSDAKYDSGSGWPSFWKPLSDASVNYKKDESFGIKRTEVECKKCGAHLGHVFDDGPKPTGKRYCINSICLSKEQDDKS